MINFTSKLIDVDDTNAYYVTFGKGKNNMILIPGIGDGFKTMKGMTIPFSILYKKYAKDYKVYVFSRRNNLKEGFTINDMANDIIDHMHKLSIDKADIVGVSQGGMIAQCIAINAPTLVNKLVLAVTISRPNEILNETVNNWIKMAQNKEYRNILIDCAYKSYTDKTIKKYEKLYKLISINEKNQSFDRFIIEAKSCLSFNSYDKLDKIKCPTLIIGAAKDKTLGIIGSNELHNKIKNSKLYIYDEYSHGVYEEAKDFNNRILAFLKEE